ncbi:neutral and basic amino acid transport protein rBAT-like [Anneissia japonica]|uniref:neutral and basic amino acid transport protein rBAT-like n=1 Tax=Anneissia japonica TaxID=1529436 RepID=UPI0014256BB4|nr:neutral and basic amino acid transport protein rBAT-like [Anneissia japonica]
MGTPDRDNYEMAPQSDRDVEKQKQVEEEEAGWTGLGKEELLQVADTPAWNWTRNVLLVLFWVTWVAMLIAAIWIVVTVPRCPDVEWWEKNVVYQVSPRSFYDTDGDGVGDLKGLNKKISYLEELKVKILYINSIFSQANNSVGHPGNHIVDFKGIDTSLGTKEDFQKLMTTATESSIKVILEFIPNHSSDQHPWFLDSKANATGPKANYYIWSEYQGPEVMEDNNPAWTKVEGRGWYYHSKDPSLPDFNYKSEDLRKDITEAMGYWLKEFGVDGMVITNVNSVVDYGIVSESRKRRQSTNDTTAAPAADLTQAMPATTDAMPAPVATTDAMPESKTTMGATEPFAEPGPTYVIHEEDKMLQEYIKQWRSVFVDNSYLGKYRLLVTSGADSIDSAVVQYGNKGQRLADFPLNTLFPDVITGEPNGEMVAEAITDWIEAKKKVDEDTYKRWDSWMVSNNDIWRVASRCSSDLVNVMNTMVLTLPGTPIIMYGQELGMQNNNASEDQQLAPMSWDKTKNANFSKGEPWTSLSDNWESNNVKVLSDKDKKDSELNIFKSLVDIHLEPPVSAGFFDIIKKSSGVLAYLRRLEDWPTYLVVINFSNSVEQLEFPSDRVQPEAEVVLSTDGSFEGDLNPQKIKMKGKSAVVFKYKALQ